MPLPVPPVPLPVPLPSPLLVPLLVPPAVPLSPAPDPPGEPGCGFHVGEPLEPAEEEPPLDGGPRLSDPAPPPVPPPS